MARLNLLYIMKPNTRQVVKIVQDLMESNGYAYYAEVFKRIQSYTGSLDQEIEEVLFDVVENQYLGTNSDNSLLYLKPAGNILLRLLKEDGFDTSESFEEYVTGCFAPMLTIQELLDAATVGMLAVLKWDKEEQNEN